MIALVTMAACAPRPTSQPDPQLEELVALDSRLATAIVARDSTGAERLLTPDFAMAWGDSSVTPAAAWLRGQITGHPLCQERRIERSFGYAGGEASASGIAILYYCDGQRIRCRYKRRYRLTRSGWRVAAETWLGPE